MENLIYQNFNAINHADEFFDSLKDDYAEFTCWLEKKSIEGESAYVLYDDAMNIDGFMYLKIEECVDDIEPILPKGRHLKIGTFKFHSKGSLRGQRFIKKILDYAIREHADDIYVTVFARHDYLIDLFEQYGFTLHGTKETNNGIEFVYVRKLGVMTDNALHNYPYISTSSNKKYLLAIYPDFHTRLFPDSILNNESTDIVEDVSYTNSIHKIYLCAMSDIMDSEPGDLLVIYRTSDIPGSARYRSVATSICVIEDVKNICEFSSLDCFLRYCEKFSVFQKDELVRMFHTKKYQYIIRFSYNVSLPKRPTRGTLIDSVGLNEQNRWGFMKLTNRQFMKIVELGGVDESVIIN
ncbi:MAG: hypothetical protein ACRDDA_07375 [Aeromonas sp.]